MAIILNQWGKTKPPPGARHNPGHQLSKDLAFHWIMNEGGGTALYDLLGRSQGAFAGSPAPVWTATPRGMTLDFNGSTARVVTSDNAFISLGGFDFTYTCWVRLDAKPTVGTIFSKGTNSGTGVITLMYRTDVDRFQARLFAFTGFSGESTLTANSLGSPTTGVWYFIVLWYNATADTWNIRVNGGSTDSIVNTGGGHEEAGVFLIGAGYPYAATPGEFFNGVIDDVRFYRRVLAPSEIVQLYVEPYADMIPMRQFIGRGAAAAPGGFQAAWARGANTVLGVRGGP